MMHQVTIKDVAAEAGVSIATVSHVLNKTRFVKPETCQRVYGAIKATKYKYNSSGRVLRNNKTNTVGVIVPNIANMYFAQIVKSLEEELYRNGYQVLLSISGSSPEKEVRLLESLEQGKVDAIALVPNGNNFDYSTLSIYDKYPFVFFSRRPDMTDYCGVFINMHDESQNAVEELIRAGHRRIACLIGPSIYSATRDRLQGYTDALAANGITYDPNLVVVRNTQGMEGYEGMQWILENTDCTAVFCANSKLTLGAIQYINENEIQIPERIAIIGRCSVEWPSVARPQMTFIKEPLKEVGKAVAEMVLERLTLQTGETKKIILNAALSERASY